MNRHVANEHVRIFHFRGASYHTAALEFPVSTPEQTTKGENS